MKKTGPPSPLSAAEYEAIERAMMETTRGRWFLTEFAERNRRQDTNILLSAIAKLETSVKQPQTFENIDRIQSDLVEMSQAIRKARSEISSLTLPEDDNSQLLMATEELDAIVTATEKATHSILQAAEDIQETVWTLREDGLPEAPCARIDQQITDIYTACSFQDITGQRTHKVVNVLRYLEARIEAMISVWGLTSEIDKEPVTEQVNTRNSDRHLLNGPPSIHEKGLGQGDVDSVLSDVEYTIEPQNPLELNVDTSPKLLISETAEKIENAAIKVEALSEETVSLAKSISIIEPADMTYSRAAEIETGLSLVSASTETYVDTTPQSSQITLPTTDFGYASTQENDKDDAPSPEQDFASIPSNIDNQLATETRSPKIEETKTSAQLEAHTNDSLQAASEAAAAAEINSQDNEIIQKAQEQGARKKNETSAMIEEANRLTDTLRSAVKDIENLTHIPTVDVDKYHTDIPSTNALDDGNPPSSQSEQTLTEPTEQSFARHIAQHLKKAADEVLEIDSESQVKFELELSKIEASLNAHQSQGGMTLQPSQNLSNVDHSTKKYDVIPDVLTPILDDNIRNAAPQAKAQTQAQPDLENRPKLAPRNLAPLSEDAYDEMPPLPEELTVSETQKVTTLKEFKRPKPHSIKTMSTTSKTALFD